MQDLHPFLTKRCRVCGDKASGFNYNGLSCESCKIFFLRNASNEKKLKCLRNGACDIDIFTRKSCPKCRLQKCLANEMILPQNKNENFRKPDTNDLLIQYIKDVVNHDFQQTDPRKLNLPPIPCIKNRSKQIASDLMSHERSLIADMQNMIQDKFVEESSLKIIGKMDNIFDAFNWAEFYGGRIVKFCKSVPAFRTLNDTDQLVMLKSFYVDILFVRFAYFWDEQQFGYPVIENEAGNHAIFVDYGVAKQFKNQTIVSNNVQFQRQLNSEIEQDFTIRDLLIAQLLFKPRDNLKCSEIIRYQYIVYCRLLQRYLQHKYKNIKQAYKKYKKLLKLLDYISVIKATGQELMKEMDTEKVSPIIIELMS